MTLRNLCSLLLIAVILIACGRSKDPEFYILNPVPLQKSPVNKYQALQIGIDEISTPAYLEKPQLVIHNSANRVQLNEYHQWAEALDKNIKRVIQTNLSTLLPGAVVETSPWDIKFTPNYHLQLDISEFTIDIQGNSLLRGEYLIYYNEHIIKKQAVYYHLKVTDPTIDKLVSSMNANLTHLTRDIANTLKTVR